MRSGLTSNHGGLIIQVGFISVCIFCLFIVIVQEFQSIGKIPGNNTRKLVHNARVSVSSDNSASEQEELGSIYEPRQVYSDATIDEASDYYLNNKSSFLHLNKLSFLIKPKDNFVSCGERKVGQAKSSDLLIFINSKWNNFKRRQQIRLDWLNKPNIRQSLCENANSTRPIRRVGYFFALGQSEDDYLSGQISASVSNESEEFNDLLVINLHEKYHDLSTKHLSIFKFILKEFKAEIEIADRERDTLALKCDDDVRINLKQLRLANLNEIPMTATYTATAATGPANDARLEARGENSIRMNEKLARPGAGDWLMCAWFPKGTPVLRNPKLSKWSLNYQEYSYNSLPAYCSGLAYITSLRFIRRLFVVANLVYEQENERPLLWIDDLLVTGILRLSLENQPLALNAIQSYCFTKQQAKYNPDCTFLDTNLY